VISKYLLGGSRNESVATVNSHQDQVMSTEKNRWQKSLGVIAMERTKALKLNMNNLTINIRLDEESQLDLQYLQQELSKYSVAGILEYSLRQAAINLRRATGTEVERQKQIW